MLAEGRNEEGRGDLVSRQKSRLADMHAKPRVNILAIVGDQNGYF
jgi:hypothetical protein